ncbi:MAG: serine/threonine-protein kinase [Cyanobacteria bacterium P01_A01_bin.114]
MRLPDPFLASILQYRYQCQRQLSKKAGRRTLLALDNQTQQPVILKLLTFSHDIAWDEIRLFQREAELLQTLSHPSIPKYIDAFEFETHASKGYAIVQGYIEAPSLAAHLNAGRCFSPDDVRHILESVLEILIYLHNRQPPVIHRDIKPSNILLTDRSGNSSGQVYLVDFGAVQTLASRGGKTITVVGTYGYMPPEQFSDVAHPASDLYSLGMTAITLLTQTHPADLPTVEMRVQFEDRVSLTPHLQTWLQQIVAPDVAARPKSAQAALQWLTSPQSFLQLSTPKPSPAKLLTTPTQLLLDAIWQSVRVGAWIGAVCGGIFPGAFFVMAPNMLVMMVLIGAASGVLLGAANGILLGVLTRLFYFPLTHLKTHRTVCTLTSIALGLFLSLLSLLPLSTSAGYGVVFIPTVVVIGSLMGIPSYKIVNRWYQLPAKNRSSA